MGRTQVARLHLYAIGDYAMTGSRPHRTATHRRQQYPTGPAGCAVGGLRALRAEKESPAVGPEWARGAEWSPRAVLDIGADRQTST